MIKFKKKSKKNIVYIVFKLKKKSKLYIQYFFYSFFKNLIIEIQATVVAPFSYYCLTVFIGLRPKLGNTYYHITSSLHTLLLLLINICLDTQARKYNTQFIYRKPPVNRRIVGQTHKAEFSKQIVRLAICHGIYSDGNRYFDAP